MAVPMTQSAAGNFTDLSPSTSPIIGSSPPPWCPCSVLVTGNKFFAGVEIIAVELFPFSVPTIFFTYLPGS
jgi:hypothetical protein